MMKRLVLIFNMFVLLLAAGCGGGGGGGGRADFSAITDWTNFGQPISGNSVKWSLFSLDETPVATLSYNRASAGQQTAVFQDVPSGHYHLRVELYANADLAGSLVGEIDEQIHVGTLKSYIAAVGTPPASIKVTPTSATFKANSGKQFYAAAYNSAQVATFIAPDTVTWQTFGSVASVNEDGFVQGMSAGSGTVVATHGPTSLQGGATLTVQAINVTNSKWTVMVFLNAANDLYKFSDLNVNQMEKVAGNPDVRFVVQWKQSNGFWVDPNDLPSFIGTRRYLVRPDTSNAIASELVQNMGTTIDMGDKQTLLEFVNWTKTFYPAERYCLVVWNHGNGWRRGPEDNRPTRAVSYDDEFGTSIQTWELAQALGSNKFDILAWDASLMQMMEVAYEIQDQAEFIVGSEESPPGAGYPYDLVFGPFRDNPDETTLNLTKNFVDGMIAAYPGDYITQSVVDASQLPNLATKVSALAQVLIANVADPATITLVQNVRNAAARYPRKPASSDFRKYRDLWDVADRLASGTAIPAIATASADVKAAIEAAVKWEDHSPLESGSHGISIDFSPASSFAGIAADYANLRFANDTQWNEWLAVAP